MAVVALLAAFVLFLAWRWWRRFRLLRRTRRVPRMTVDELESRRLAGSLPGVIDVRAHGDAPMERIPGSVVLDMQGALDSLDALGVPQAEADIVVYCACPHELSAALLAERLRVAGYHRTWALAGGFDEWKRRHGGAVPTEAANQSGPAAAA
jgi:rhodanese-related sulfurtransferase